MEKQNQKLLQPQYVSNFKCIGSDCEDSCCIGWKVVIDKSTYKKYRECTDTDLRILFGETVTRQRIGATELDYAKIKLNHVGECPFVDADKLCAIQRKLGEEYLSVTCTTYPRSSNQVNGRLEKSLTLSCPEATRLVLLNPELMEFDDTQEDVSIRNNHGRILDTTASKLAYKPQRYFWELRVFIISLLQNRSYPLWQRLLILGLFCRQLDKLISEAKTNDIPQLLATYINRLEQGIFRTELNNIPEESTIQMEIMKELADQRIFTGVTNWRFIECFNEFLYGIDYAADAQKEEIGERYAAAYTTYYQPFMEKHEYILENYVVNYVFKNLFPFSGEKHIFDNYVMLIVHYAMIKMLLIGMAGFHKEKFSIDHVVKLIQSFSRTIEHNNAYLKGIFQLLKNNNCNTMAHMVILIKN